MLPGRGLESKEAIEESVHWAMGLRRIFVLTAGDMQLISKMPVAAEGFEGSRPGTKCIDL